MELESGSAEKVCFFFFCCYHRWKGSRGARVIRRSSRTERVGAKDILFLPLGGPTNGLGYKLADVPLHVRLSRFSQRNLAAVRVEEAGPLLLLLIRENLVLAIGEHTQSIFRP